MWVKGKKTNTHTEKVSKSQSTSEQEKNDSSLYLHWINITKTWAGQQIQVILAEENTVACDGCSLYLDLIVPHPEPQSDWKENAGI